MPPPKNVIGKPLNQTATQPAPQPAAQPPQRPTGVTQATGQATGDALVAHQQQQAAAAASRTPTPGPVLGANLAYQAHKEALTPTPSDIEGPFYRSGAPFRSRLINPPRMVLSGRVVDTQGRPVKGAILDFWMADEKGVYDEEGYSLRGRVLVDDRGAYSLGAARPGHYLIGPGEERCSHVHVKVGAPGCVPLTTQLYFPDDADANEKDHWFKKELLVDVTSTSDASCVHFDFVLAFSSSSPAP